MMMPNQQIELKLMDSHGGGDRHLINCDCIQAMRIIELLNCQHEAGLDEMESRPLRGRWTVIQLVNGERIGMSQLRTWKRQEEDRKTAT